MGAWGPRVSDDDLACDVREKYLMLLHDGHDGVVCSDAVLEHFGEVLADQTSAAVLWLALAVLQWRVGRLEDRVKGAALQAIADGSAIRLFEDDARLLRARTKELTKVSALLNSRQPKPRKVHKRFKNSCDWEVGELIAFRLRSGRNVILRVVGLWTDDGGTMPVVELLDWCGEEIPSLGELELLPIRIKVCAVPPWFAPSSPPPLTSQFVIVETSARHIPHDRITRLNMRLRPSQEVGGFQVWRWRSIDEQLERDLGFR